MKISHSLLTLFAGFCIVLPSYAQTSTTNTTTADKELFEFTTSGSVGTEAPKAPAAETKVVTEIKTETKVEAPVKVEPKPEPAPAALVADAQTMIRDKLVQKYQVRLDEVIGRMTTRLSPLPVADQRIALKDLRDRMSEKKAFVLEKKDLEPLKRDIILAILDHVIYRLDGLVKQSAQTTVEGKIQA